MQYVDLSSNTENPAFKVLSIPNYNSDILQVKLWIAILLVHSHSNFGIYTLAADNRVLPNKHSFCSFFLMIATMVKDFAMLPMTLDTLHYTSLLNVETLKL